MTRGVRPLTGALVAVLFVGAATARAQITLAVVPESRVVEGNGPQVVNLTIQISAPNLSGVTSVQWYTQAGTAAAGSDFMPVSPTTVTWSLGDGAPKNISVTVVGDTIGEWSPTTQMDETFFVKLQNPVGATIAKPSATVTILDDDHPTLNQRPGVQFLSAISGSVSPHGGGDGQVRLQWRVAPAQTAPTQIKIQQDSNFTAACTFPPADTAGLNVANLAPAAAGLTQFFTHSNLTTGSVHCYSVFAIYAGGPTTQIGQIKGTPFSAAFAIAWKFTASSTILVPPTVGSDAIYVTDTAGVVHALQRGTGGGMWPSTWNPVAVGQTNMRSAVVPRPEGARLYLGTDGGEVHSIDGRFGTLVWSRSAAAGTNLPTTGGAQAQPSGIFKNFGGSNDMLLVGTNAALGSNALWALDPATGNVLDSLSTGGMGTVLGMPVLDYAGNRVFFLTSSSTDTVIGMTLGASGSPDLVLDTTLAWNPKPAGGGSNGSLVLRNGRFYFGDSANLFALHMDGTLYGTITGDGAIKGFVWPDRSNDNVFFATNGKVHAVRDTGSGFVDVISPVSVTSPSIVLQKPGTTFLYVGDGLGNLVQINLVAGVLTTLLETGVQIGAPSLDAPNSMVIVGSNTGSVYAVRVPF
jgi:hypothetical protein